MTCFWNKLPIKYLTTQFKIGCLPSCLVSFFILELFIGHGSVANNKKPPNIVRYKDCNKSE